MSIVEVFRTTVGSHHEAARLTAELRQRFPTWRISFDLDDCDNILRVAGEGIGGPEIREIIALLSRREHTCVALE